MTEKPIQVDEISSTTRCDEEMPPLSDDDVEAELFSDLDSIYDYIDEQEDYAWLSQRVPRRDPDYVP